jgi:hypothetical protein
MPRHVAILPGRLYPQPEYSIQVDQEGKWSVTQVFLCHRNSAVALMPRPGSIHPDVPFVAASQVTARITAGDLAEVTCVYTGAEAPNGEDEAPSVYTMGLSLSEEPILSHIRYKDLEDEEIEALQAIASGRETDDAGASNKDKVTSELGKEVLAKIQRGQTSYYSPKITWKESFVRDQGVKASDLNKIGEIDDPSGSAPGLAQGRNWLLNGVSQTQEGRSFRIEREWLASDRGGWDSDIYED